MKIRIFVVLCACLAAALPPLCRAHALVSMLPATVIAAEDTEGEGETGQEPEGEGEPAEGETPPPAEGEAPPPPGTLTGVTLLAPRGDVVTPDGTARLLFAAQVLVEGGALDPAQVIVLFELGDLPEQAAWHDGLVHYLLADVDVDESAPLTVRVTARHRATGEEVHSEGYEFLVRRGEDLDGNGFADNPFAELPGAADFWTALTGDPACPRAVGMLAMHPGADPSLLLLPNPRRPEQFVGVTVSDALLPALSRGVLIAAIACDPARLFAPYDAAGLTAAPPGLLAENGLYIEVSLILSDDGGLTYREATPLELAAHPARISLSHLQGRAGAINRFYAFPSSVESDPGLGIRIVPLTGQWSAEGIRDLGLSADNAIHTIEVRRLSVFAPFEVPHPGELKITPAPELPYHFGVVPVNQVRTAEIMLANTGGEPLECRVALDDPEGVFKIQGASVFALHPGAQQTLRVQFVPGAARAYEARLTFAGDPAGTKTMPLRGRGVAEEKNVRPLGCGPAGHAAPGTRAADAALMLGVAWLLFRRDARRKRAAIGRTQGDAP